MAVTVQWGPKSFVVSPGQVVPVRDLTTGYSRKSETNNDTSGQPTTNDYRPGTATGKILRLPI